MIGDASNGPQPAAGFRRGENMDHDERNQHTSSAA
jgi:hypothetical protein